MPPPRSLRPASTSFLTLARPPATPPPCSHPSYPVSPPRARGSASPHSTPRSAQEESKKFAFRTGLKICVAYGGAPFGDQMRELERGCDVLVATPGRLDDMISRGRVTLQQVQFLVLDEADRMLDMGFEPQIRNIIDRADMPVREQRQTMMFSATFPRTVMRIADSFLNNPVMLKVGRVGGAAATVTQKVIYVDGRDKTPTCVEMLKAVAGKTIIFVNTKRSADQLEDDLYSLGCPAASVHGDKDQVRTRARTCTHTFLMRLRARE